MEFKDVLFSRRSTRDFTDRKLTRDEINEMLEAAINAPNACNMQSWHFYAVTDEAVRAKFGDGIVSDWAAKAPVIFVVCTDGEAIIERFGERADRLFIIQDTSAAIENLLLRAVDMGFGGCWMGCFDEKKCRELLNIPASQMITAVVPVGEPSSVAPKRPRKPLSEVVTYVGQAPETLDDGQHSGEEKPFSLSGADLPNASFRDLGLAKASFDNINMEQASFNNINMHGVKFSDINMRNTFFGGLNLSQSFFGCVDFNDASFENPCFDGATFKNCSFKNVTFENCEFEAKIFAKDGSETLLK